MSSTIIAANENVFFMMHLCKEQAPLTFRPVEPAVDDGRIMSCLRYKVNITLLFNTFASLLASKTLEIRNNKKKSAETGFLPFGRVDGKQVNSRGSDITPERQQSTNRWRYSNFPVQGQARSQVYQLAPTVTRYDIAYG